MKSSFFAVFLVSAFAGGSVFAAEKLTITVTHDLAIARPAETITIPWSEVNNALPHALLQRIAVKDAAGHILPYQVTNVAPQAKDPNVIGIAYGELIFQHDFAAGEKSATFTIEKTETVSPVFPSKAFARYVPERLDDFAWENDKIGHRTYGPALAAPAPEGSKKEVLVTSGLDVWCKRVSYPIVDRWYNKGHDHYHHDEGEGMDMYNVGKSRGCGGTGVWDNGILYAGTNYKSWKVLANGPIRAIFELTYDAWDANGVQVSEVKRFTVDAGHNLDRIDSTFVFAGPAELTVAVGLNKNNADKNQEPKTDVIQNEASAILGQWIVQKANESLGTAIILSPGTLTGFIDETGKDVANLLALTKAKSGKPVTYYVGAGWSRAGEFKAKTDWENYLQACAACIASPVKITCAASK
jgi:pectinesterase